MKKEYSKKEIKQLKARAHGLNVAVMVGKNEVSQSVLDQINQSLETNELIKIKISCEDQQEFKVLLTQVVDNVEATLVNKVGHTAVLYREKSE